MTSTPHQFQTIAHYLLYKHHLTPLFTALQHNQIEFIVFKGWSFIPDLYPDPASRPFTDVDILIRPQDYHIVIARMAELGFVRAGSKPALSQMAELGFVRAGSKPAPPHIPLEITCSHPVGVHIDLHTHILQLAWWHPAFPIEIDEVWRTAQNYRDETGIEALRFSPEITFLHLCLHLFNHGIFYTQSHIYRDLGKVLSKYGPAIDWLYVSQKSKEWGMENMVHWVVKTLAEDFNITPPVTFQSKASHNGLQYRLIKSYYKARHQSHTGSPWRTAFLLRLALIDDLSKLPKLLLSALFPSPALRAAIHNQPCSLLNHWRKYTLRLLRQ